MKNRLDFLISMRERVTGYLLDSGTAEGIRSEDTSKEEEVKIRADEGLRS